VDLTLAGLTFTSAHDDVWRTDGDRSLTGEAGARTDLFLDPSSSEIVVNAPRLLTPPPPGDFQLSATVTSALRATFDAGALLLWATEDTWAKFAFEYSPQGSGMIVSVITRGRSDDANGYTVAGDSVGLRISRIGPAYAFHASTDGRTWDFVRHFTLGTVNAAVGFEVQSPTGEGCRATFTDITLSAQTLGDLRDGR
jgi:regulation of enolase protein 1 (concanavalin A-like superfamily)